jgi:predicted ester cyclase
MTSTVTHMLAEGDLIAVRNGVTGTQHGPLGELRATGNRVDFTSLQLFRVEDELIAGHADPPVRWLEGPWPATIARSRRCS